MKFIIALSLVSVALAAPSLPGADSIMAKRTSSGFFTCTGLVGGKAACCATNLLGVVSLDCSTPTVFGCATGSPVCCTVVIADQGFLCDAAITG
ncbi:hypothetical protein E4U55_001207 [Claviceps digitariae]|nr:hypothetical protein E4U55_001207 [Claviceps digitariae]